ncbi:MAG: hypothetical protein V4568_17710 [Pseudomonadota bacterium]
MRFWVVTLLLANLVFAAYVYVSETKVSAAPSTDLNANKVRVVPFIAKSVPVPAPEVATAATTTTATASGICLQWSGIAANDLQQAKDFLTPLMPASNVVESRIEEPTRFWVNIPPTKNPMAMLVRLKAAGISDASLMQPSHTISLGLFRTEAAAERYLEEIQGKGFAQAQIEPRNLQVTEVTLVVKGVSPEFAAKLNEFKNQFDGSTVHPVDCSIAEKDKKNDPNAKLQDDGKKHLARK